ncbi:hypothetical protein [Hyphomonas atlantica corrig.]|uniref:hypothetical protein n=1 Tax=Hyphomonas atlantica TaxID=1280948 RepID=UPI002357A4BB|nr:hypothetical protein [Hyphomonas atlantica]
MILRRLTTALRKQDWVTVLIETLIVVLGVFLGLQVNNWNSARADRELGKQYTTRLVADLEQDLAGNLILRAYYDQVLASVAEADRLLDSPDANPKDLVAAAYRASEFGNNPTDRATWDQIVSSGHLGLLPSQEVADGLSEYYKFQDLNDETNSLLQGTPYRFAVRALIPLPLQLAIREGCSDTVDEAGIITGFVAECRIDVDEAVLEAAALELKSSPSIREALRHQYSMVATVRNNIDGNIATLEIVIDGLRNDGVTP